MLGRLQPGSSVEVGAALPTPGTPSLWEPVQPTLQNATQGGWLVCMWKLLRALLE